MMHFPPAVSEFGLFRIARSFLLNKPSDFDEHLCIFFGANDVIVGNSWVKVLAKTLDLLSKKFPNKTTVILPSFCCSEFPKAVLLAGLKPKFIDLGSDYTMDLDWVKNALDEKTLAVIAVNNTGVESDNQRIKEICEQHGVVCIEDATYGYFGTSSRYPGRKFGSFGDFAVLNFSEGKTIPVGGGAVLLNNSGFKKEFTELKKNLYAVPPQSNAQELKSLVIYKAGASRWGYEVYQRLKKWIGVDFKSKFAMEPVRVSNPIDRDLVFTDSREVVYNCERKKEMETIQLRPFNKVKRLCGIDIINNHSRYKIKKEQKHRFYEKRLNHLNGPGKLLKMPKGAMLVKAPYNFEKEVSPDLIQELGELGVIKQYPTVHPMYQYKEHKNSCYFYECTFTLPIHKNIRRKDQLKIISILEKYAVHS